MGVVCGRNCISQFLAHENCGVALRRGISLGQSSAEHVSVVRIRYRPGFMYVSCKDGPGSSGDYAGVDLFATVKPSEDLF